MVSKNTNTPTRRHLSGVLTLALAVVAIFAATPVRAHGTGLVQLCERSSSSSCTSAVFAVCDPGVPQHPCSDPRDIEIRVSNFPANTTVYLWWLKSAQATHPLRNDCTQAVAQDRVSLGSVTTDSSGTGGITGKAEQDDTLPRAAWTNDNDWVYGPNWVCATTAASPGGAGTVGDRLFTIYPV